ncbi:MAG: phosphoglucomutase/phosphomannomutase family protein [bacterium]
MISFGTDGWRGYIARDFTFENLQLVALATASYLKKAAGKKPRVVIGYDTRFLSKEFAIETAKILAWKDISVQLTNGIATTPEISYHTKQKGADMGIVITASHNPPVYNGYKLKASFGGPATTEQIAKVEAELKRIFKRPPQIRCLEFSDYIKMQKISYFDPKESYFRHIKKKIDIDTIRKAKFKILYDPMYGAGIGLMKELLPDSDELHNDYNPSFGNLEHPEPIAENLKELIQNVRRYNYDIGIASDGDADRLGAVDQHGNFVDSHKIFMILLKYLYEERKKRGIVVKTVSLTSMVDKFCAKNKIQLIETPVGFKHSAKIMSEQNVLIGGEESGGLGTILHIPERDGIFNALLLMEVMAERGKSLKQLCDELDEEFGIHKFQRRDVQVTPALKEQILKACKKKPAKIGKFDILTINDKDGFKFIVEDGWLLVRASGTEPLLRFYSEGKTLSMVNELLDEGMKLK